MRTILLSTTWLLTGAALALKQGFLPRNQNWNIGQTVRTSSGPVIGTAGTVVPDVSSYLGIPFAKHPIGDLRFAPPKEYRGHATINGTKMGHSCPISSNFGILPNITDSANLTTIGKFLPYALAQLGDTFSEDCLTVNIWTKPQIGDSRKAVLVWIYGGGYTSGSNTQASYNGEHIVDDEDVIVVSLNYRTNIFGFPGNPYGTDNLGFLDQRLAIEWIRSNIAAFGGDPSRITLFGQSAGGGSIDYYSYAWMHDPIVAGLILQSGTAGLGAYPKNLTSAAWYNVTDTLNCGTAASEPSKVLECMRSKNFTDILEAIPEQGGIGGSASFWPTIDEKVVFSDYSARSAAGQFIKVPMLIGNTDYEGGFFETVAQIDGMPQPQSFWEGFNDVVFDCPAADRANISVKAGLPTWRYRYFGDFPDLKLTTVPDSGAYHSSELTPLFGNYPPAEDGIPPPTGAEIEIGSYMRGAWAAFAKDPAKGLKNYGWPVYQPGKKTLVRLAYENRTGTNAEVPALYDGACQDQVPARRRL